MILKARTIAVGLWFDPFGKIPEFIANTRGEPWIEKSGEVTEFEESVPIRNVPIGWKLGPV